VLYVKVQRPTPTGCPHTVCGGPVLALDVAGGGRQPVSADTGRYFQPCATSSPMHASRWASRMPSVKQACSRVARLHLPPQQHAGSSPTAVPVGADWFARCGGPVARCCCACEPCRAQRNRNTLRRWPGQTRRAREGVAAGGTPRTRAALCTAPSHRHTRVRKWLHTMGIVTRCACRCDCPTRIPSVRPLELQRHAKCMRHASAAREHQAPDIQI
jgi:hypothetical protein